MLRLPSLPLILSVCAVSAVLLTQTAPPVFLQSHHYLLSPAATYEAPTALSKQVSIPYVQDWREQSSSFDGVLVLARNGGDAIASTRLLNSMPCQVQANDASVYIAVAVMVGAVTLIAGYVPASRAARIDPAVALRQE